MGEEGRRFGGAWVDAGELDLLKEAIEEGGSEFAVGLALTMEMGRRAGGMGKRVCDGSCWRIEHGGRDAYPTGYLFVGDIEQRRSANWWERLTLRFGPYNEPLPGLKRRRNGTPGSRAAHVNPGLDYLAALRLMADVLMPSGDCIHDQGAITASDGEL